MSYTNEQFYSVLFDEGDFTCFAKHAKGTKVYPASEGLELPWASFFSINALHATEDLNPTEDYHSADKPRRADHNVIKYRSILIEMDKIALKDQTVVIRDSGAPFSTAVFSGNKSYHFIITLETPLASKAEYDSLVLRVYKALGGKDVVDVANKNPSRLSRAPGATRDNGNLQKLMYVGARVANATLEAWLVSKGCPKVEPKPRQTPKKHDPVAVAAGFRGHLNPWTKNFLMFGADEGERNLTLFKAACDFAKTGHEIEEAIDRLAEPSGLSSKEAEGTIRSAYRKVGAS